MPRVYARLACASRRTLAKGLLCAASALLPCSLPAIAGTRLVPAPPAARKASLRAEVKDQWMGLYLGPRKIGYAGVHTEPTTYQGKPALRTTSKGITRLTVMGVSVEQDESSVTVTDRQYRPLFQTFDVRSNGSVVALEARYDYAAH